MKKRLRTISVLTMIVGMLFTSALLFSQNDANQAGTVIDNSNSQCSEKTVTTDWCVEHAVPESECTACNPSLIDKYKASGDWCGGHGLPESHCRLCNPEIQFPQKLTIAKTKTELDWCAKHSVPESECALCNPSLIDKYKASGDWCGGHGLPESHCRLCNPEIKFPQEEILKARLLETFDDEIKVSLFFRSNTKICATNDALIQFASANTAERSGFTFRRALSAQYESALDAPAEIIFNEDSTTVIASSVKALVSHWLVSPGDIVKNDDPIAILQSSEMAELQARLISTFAELEVQKEELRRDEKLASKNLISKSNYERRMAFYKKAQAEYIGARGLLLSCGINNHDIDELLENNIVSNRFVLRANDSGIIARRIAKVGESLEDGEALAIVTNPSSMWIEAQLPEDHLKEVAIGQNLYFTSDDGALNRVKGSIIWVSPYLDTDTRTGIVRAQVKKNSQGLRAGEFGRVTISESCDTESILVPKDAVQWEGCCNVVFIRESPSRFRPRKVELADGPGSYYQVTEGLLPGEEVVVTGSFLLKTELKKTSIGAGCCDFGPES
ncbi:MAG: efflux RND transporter periplasmic adaptor subunit [candidate division Zixibacteria bacterium]|nr:efflux RND transporter periplasmic adaptor subunit [candidate division Zixibacteria bacterium]